MTKYEALNILNLSKKATVDEIKKTFKFLARKYHPDLAGNNSEETKKRFSDISEAYNYLLDLKNKEYERKKRKNKNFVSDEPKIKINLTNIESIDYTISFLEDIARANNLSLIVKRNSIRTKLDKGYYVINKKTFFYIKKSIRKAFIKKYAKNGLNKYNNFSVGLNSYFEFQIRKASGNQKKIVFYKSLKKYHDASISFKKLGNNFFAKINLNKNKNHLSFTEVIHLGKINRDKRGKGSFKRTKKRKHHHKKNTIITKRKLMIASNKSKKIVKRFLDIIIPYSFKRHKYD